MNLRCSQSASRIRPASGRGTRSAFTLVELLTVIGIVLILISLLIVALNAASRRAQVARTENLINSVRQGLIAFKADIGYLPPILGHGAPSKADDLRALWQPPTPAQIPNWYQDPGDPTKSRSIDNWYSITSLADFLIGYGNEQEDGYGHPADPLRPYPGIRNPESDGAWFSTLSGSRTGLRSDRNLSGTQSRTAKIYGPYIELTDERLLGRVKMVNNTAVILLPGDAGYVDPTDPDPPVMTIVDYWGMPLRYYRPAYPTGSLKAGYRRPVDMTGNGTPDGIPSLSDVFALRPYHTEVGAEADGYFADTNGDTTSSYALKTAEFAILSTGPDKAMDPNARVDDEIKFDDDVPYENEDNIIGVGP